MRQRSFFTIYQQSVKANFKVNAKQDGHFATHGTLHFNTYRSTTTAPTRQSRELKLQEPPIPSHVAEELFMRRKN